MLHIIKNIDTGKYNLAKAEGPDEGSLVLKEWGSCIDRIKLQVTEESCEAYYLVVTANKEYLPGIGQSFWSQSLLDDKGKTLFTAPSISVWYEGYAKNSPILMKAICSEGKYRNVLCDIDGKELSEPFDTIATYASTFKGFIRVTKDEQVNFLRLTDFHLVGTKWFEKYTYDNTWKYRGNPHFVAKVKQKGRWRILWDDGSVTIE